MTVKQGDYPGRPNHSSLLNLSPGIKDRDVRLKAWERCYMLLLAWRWRGSHGKECQLHLNWEQPPTNIPQENGDFSPTAWKELNSANNKNEFGSKFSPRTHLSWHLISDFGEPTHAVPGLQPAGLWANKWVLS